MRAWYSCRGTANSGCRYCGEAWVFSPLAFQPYCDEPWTWTGNLQDYMKLPLTLALVSAVSRGKNCLVQEGAVAAKTAVAAGVVLSAFASVFAVVLLTLHTLVGKCTIFLRADFGPVAFSSSALMSHWRTATAKSSIAAQKLECH